MQEPKVIEADAPRLGALLRYLQTEQIEHVVSDEPSDSNCSNLPLTACIVVAAETLPLLPTVLNEFCRRHDLQLVHHHCRARDELFMFSWLNEKQRPDFMSLRVQRNAAKQGSWLQRKFDQFRRWREPSGLLIACLGPEGSGRSNVVEQLGTQPLAPFAAAHVINIRPRMMRPVPVDPESRVPRGRLGTMAKLMMFVADYWLGYWWRIRPKLVASTMVVSNRYFDDILVDPSYYRIDRFRSLARWLLPWIPRPELWLVLDVPSERLADPNAGNGGGGGRTTAQ